MNAPKVSHGSPSPDRSPTGTVGDVLRTTYQETVAEQIPDEFLDLLNKLQ